MSQWEVWLKGVLAAGIAGGANGVITGFAAVGIDPSHFNLQAGLHSTLAIAAVSARDYRSGGIFEAVAAAGVSRTGFSLSGFEFLCARFEVLAVGRKSKEDRLPFGSSG
jgi:hypothetical protein